MIGLDTDETLYFLSKDNTKVYKVKNNKITDTIELKDSNVITTYHNNQRVFLIYSDYVIEVSSSNPLNSVGKIPDKVTFEAIKSNKMYVRVDEDTLKQIDLNLEKLEYDSEDIVDGQEKYNNTNTKPATNNNNTPKVEEKKEEKKEEKVVDTKTTQNDDSKKEKVDEKTTPEDPVVPDDDQDPDEDIPSGS